MKNKQDNQSYLIPLDYGSRTSEREFISSVLKRYDQQILRGVTLFVNNNPYNLEFFLLLNFGSGLHDFDSWLAEYRRENARKYNWFVSDFLQAIQKKGYGFATVRDDRDLDPWLTEHGNELFLFPERAIMNAKFGGEYVANGFTVFLVHSSRDKDTADQLFNEFQKREFRAWYDKYEISPGDSVGDKVDEGLARSDVGVILLSKASMDPKSGWPLSELNYFFQRRMRSGRKEFICINLDLTHEEIPPRLQDYRYENYDDGDGLDAVVVELEKLKKLSTQRG